ncbi:unnamed protein product [Kluyveromyces dobzhanskii CBS 2104]|uniref:WGS project CCBQ000000000 data, contig 00028 n=1 Tax=Kluyveromyces dobzhanskii CBS 2104 TaxID=1427455 RepID=A0A0A8KZ05_9SACH|nr:unnamed protein product [Kluyveromyces dobzhanskii CBS 2104]
MSRALTRTQLKSVIKTISRLYPESYADSAWDNTGLLIDCSVEGEHSDAKVQPKVLLTIDLTESVAKEALDNKCNLIVAYHPFIFPSWKKLAPHSNPQHASAIKLIQNEISVYSPHTAIDAAKNGVNDWLVSSLGGNVASNKAIERVNPTQGEEEYEVGYGRVVELIEPLSLNDIISNVKATLGISHVQVATKSELSDHKIKKVSLCAGSGSGVFKGLREDVDLYYTGELSHHEVLKYKESGKAVIVCNHSNTERGFIRKVMHPALVEQGIDCIVSRTDIDPLQVV